MTEEDSPRTRNNGTWIAYYNEDDQYDREDGPAVIYVQGPRKGDKHWYRADLRHREDGPAVERNNGVREWWLFDEKYSERRWNIKLLELGLGSGVGKPVELEL